MSFEHAARLLEVSRRTIYNWIGDRRLQTIRTPGGSQRVLLESVEEMREHAPVSRRANHRSKSW